MTTEAKIDLSDEDDESYVDSVRRFIAAADYLTEEHRPALKVLRSLAKVLDRELDAGKAPQAALVSQFSLTYRALVQAGGAKGGDEDDSLPPPMF